MANLEIGNSGQVFSGWIQSHGTKSERNNETYLKLYNFVPQNASCWRFLFNSAEAIGKFCFNVE